VIYQSLEQQLIVAKTLWRGQSWPGANDGIPLAQSFDFGDKAPYAAFDEIDVDSHPRSHANRKDLAAMVRRPKRPRVSGRRPTADRLPITRLSMATTGDIGVNLKTSHGTGDARARSAFRFSGSTAALASTGGPGATGHGAWLN